MRIAGLMVRYRSRWALQGLWKRNQQIHLPKLIEKLYAKEIALNTLRNGMQQGFFIDNEDMEANHGLSLYFGSRQLTLISLTFTRNAMNCIIKKISPEESLEIFGIWNRYELRFSDQKAQGAIEEYINGDLWGNARKLSTWNASLWWIQLIWSYKPDQKWQIFAVEPFETLNQSSTLLYWTNHLLANFPSGELLALVSQKPIESCRPNTWRWYKT